MDEKAAEIILATTQADLRWPSEALRWAVKSGRHVAFMPRLAAARAVACRQPVTIGVNLPGNFSIVDSSHVNAKTSG